MAAQIRNFCIIAHIDHGKSTLADRFLEFTGTVEKREMKAQLLDQMDLERERGITIKLQPVRMNYKRGAQDYILNLIDTPGHVDFTYEVSRSLAAVEGAVLLVDASQGVQAQTIGNLYLAIEQGLEIIPVINKIDLPAADVEKTAIELIALLGCKREDIILASGKTGQGLKEIIAAVIDRVPPPREASGGEPLRALIFDSAYDEYKGVVAFVRVMEGSVARGMKMGLPATGAKSEVLEVGWFKPKFVTADGLAAGEIGYVVTGLKDISACRVGDTVTVATYKEDGIQPLPGYKEIKPMVFAGIFPKEGDQFQNLREGLLKLKLSDASLSFEPEQSSALGFGFRCGLLGLLHLEILQERLVREHDLKLIVTVPSVAYEIVLTKGATITIKSPSELPDMSQVERIREPWVKADIVVPKQYIGNVMGMVVDKRGEYKTMEYLGAGEATTVDDVVGARVIMHFEVPLASILVDFYDKLKSVSSGYGSLNYELLEYRSGEIVKMDILVADDPVEALSMMVIERDAQRIGRKVCEVLKEEIPQAQFEIKIQAAIGGKIVASERIKPFRKDVTGYLYGGDVTRKKKLLEKQKKGKKKMMGLAAGGVDIPPEAFIAVLKRRDEGK